MPAQSIEILERFDEPALLPWATFLRNYKLHPDPELYVECYASLAALKREAVQKDDQALAKAIWCLETVAKVQDHYITAFQGLCSSRFEEAWRHLEMCVSEAIVLAYHFLDHELEFGVAFARTHAERFQELFPLKWGVSPELVSNEVRCSVCDVVLTLRDGCGHEQGEIYDGEMCHQVVSRWELIAVSLVDNPVQKSTMIFPEKRELLDPIMQIARSLESPWRAWKFHKPESTEGKRGRWSEEG